MRSCTSSNGMCGNPSPALASALHAGLRAHVPSPENYVPDGFGVGKSACNALRIIVLVGVQSMSLVEAQISMKEGMVLLLLLSLHVQGP